MRQRIERIVNDALGRLSARGRNFSGVPVTVEPPKDERFGDFTTNVAMAAASRLRVAPRPLAEELIAELCAEPLIEKAEVAGPGFINLTLRREAWHEALLEASLRGDRIGDVDVGRGRRVMVEFVSANPTGPLHVGHGRGAAVGDVLANLLRTAGFDVVREYYINDAGRQMLMLGQSTLARYRELLKQPANFPEDGYKGEYLFDVARDLASKRGAALLEMDEKAAVAQATDFAVQCILDGIRRDLADFGVVFDEWVSERALLAEHPLEELLADLGRAGVTYEAEGATWLRTTTFGDDKDRVLIRTNGPATYFANDILYHREKYRRGFDLIIDIWGADHHGYVARMKAAVQTLGRSPDDLQVILVQLVRLLRAGQPVAMSTRAGEFDTLRQVLDEVGRDAARFSFLTRKADAQLDFDLELAVKQSSENPVFYVQYAHARVQSVLRKLPEAGIDYRQPTVAGLARLELPEELALLRAVVLYPDMVAAAAESLEPHRVAFFLQDLASRFHTYYNRHRIVTADEELTRARIFLVSMIGRVVAHGLGILGVTAPETM